MELYIALFFASSRCSKASHGGSTVVLPEAIVLCLSEILKDATFLGKAIANCFIRFTLLRMWNYVE